MLKALNIGHIPCFREVQPSSIPLQQLTFIYGPNGSGKSSIAKSMKQAAEDELGLDCELYNKEFTDRLLKSDAQIPGVLVIRDADKETQERLEALTDPTNGVIPLKQTKKTDFESTKSRQEGLISEARLTLKNECWALRKELPNEMHSAFQGYLGSAEKFIDEVLRRRKVETNSQPRPEEELVATFKALDLPEQTPQGRLTAPTGLIEPTPETVRILSSPLKGKEETSFGKFVEILNNSDWVRQGKYLISYSEGVCPFCQQGLPHDIKADLEALFDEYYESSLRSIRQYVETEESNISKIETFIQTLNIQPEPLFDNLIDAASSLLKDAQHRRDNLRIKTDLPSESVTLTPYREAVESLSSMVDEANQEIDKRNQLLSDRTAARSQLNDEVWDHFILRIAQNSLSSYDGATHAPSRALTGLTPKLTEITDQLRALSQELAEIQSRTSSSLPTVKAINGTLTGLGFCNFKLEKLSQEDTYRIIRQDGALAAETLSEGERTLVSFLYFYHMLNQKNSAPSTEGGVVAVFDDPVSSLDGETLFVINTLLRNIIEGCTAESNSLKQVILLTHNAYFLKEATFTPTGMKAGSRQYYTIRKGADGQSMPVSHTKMPIKSNYSQLWDQVKEAHDNPEAQFSASLPNSMRRIIENYFHITGDVDSAKIIANIPESERWACRALLAWYNDGSHTAPWDVDYSSISPDIDSHLSAFKKIFEESGHIAHYDMMMNSAYRD